MQGNSHCGKTMPSELKEAVLSAFKSRQMHDYLYENFDKLREYDIINILMGADMPLIKKADLFGRLAMEYPCEAAEQEDDYCSGYGSYAEMMRLAVSHMEYNEEERAVYVLRAFERMHECGEKLFLSFDAALGFAVSSTDEMLDSQPGLNPDNMCWHFEIEKWIPSSDGAMEKLFTYLILPDGTVISAEYCDTGRMGCHYYNNSDSLDCPVPFNPGDVVTVDCMPYECVRHCVIVTVGDNRDCCHVQCVYWDDEEGRAEIGAFKHTQFIGMVPYSPLYRAEMYTGVLPEEEKFMRELGSAIKAVPEDEECLLELLHGMADAGVAAYEWADKLKEYAKTGNTVWA